MSRREAKRARVLEVAARTLNSFGVSHASLPTMAEELGVSRAALYYYFADQEDLVFQSYQRSCELLAEHLSNASLAGGDAMAVIENFINGVFADGEQEIAAFTEIAYLSEERRNTILGLIRPIHAGLAAILIRGAAAGTLRRCESGIVAAAILGLATWLHGKSVWRTRGSLSHQDMVEAIKSLLREGIAADRTGPVEIRPMVLQPRELSVSDIFDSAALAAARKESVLAAASWLFNQRGVDATSLDEVAMRLGVTKKVIYHHLGDKETLVAECYRRSFLFYEEIARRATVHEGSRMEAFIAATWAYAEANLRQDVAPLSPMTGLDALPPGVMEEINASAVRMFETFIELFAQGQREGSLRLLNVRAYLYVRRGTSEWLPKWYDTLSARQRALAPRELAELNRIGLLPI